MKWIKDSIHKQAYMYFYLSIFIVVNVQIIYMIYQKELNTYNLAKYMSNKLMFVVEVLKKNS